MTAPAHPFFELLLDAHDEPHTLGTLDFTDRLADPMWDPTTDHDIIRLTSEPFFSRDPSCGMATIDDDPEFWDEMDQFFNLGE